MSPPRSNHVEFLQLELAIADTDAGFQLVLVAVPRADEMHFVGERLPLIGAVGADDVEHLVDHQALAGRAAGVDAVIAVGVIGAVLVEHADFLLAGADDTPVAVRQFGHFGDEPFCHGVLQPP